MLLEWSGMVPGSFEGIRHGKQIKPIRTKRIEIGASKTSGKL